MIENVNGNETETKILRVAIYARVSTEDQAEEETPIAAQIRECEDFAASKGWEVVNVFKDGGISGRTDDRPAFQEMMALAKEKPKVFDVIVAWKSNRLSRKLEHRLTYQALLRRKGIRVALVKEPEMEGALGFLIESILAVVDEFLTLQIGEDVLRGQKEIARQGFSAGGRPPKGYRSASKVVGLKRSGEPLVRTAWEPDPEWRDQALLAFQMASEGSSFTEIVLATGVVKNKSSLSTYLHNRVFLGQRVYNRQRHVETKAIRVNNPENEWVITEGAHEAIVTEELFGKVQIVLGNKRKSHFSERTMKSDYLLSGLLWCTTHQCNYVGWANSTREYYACSLRNKSLIPASECRLIKKAAIEEFVIGVVADEILQPGCVSRGLVIMDQQSRRDKELVSGAAEGLKVEAIRVEGELRNYQDAISRGVNPDALAGPINQCYESLNKLNGRLDGIDTNKQPTMNVSEKAVNQVIEAARTHLNESATEDKKLFLREMLSQVAVTGENLEISYTFKNPGEKVAPVMAPRHRYNAEPS